MLRHVITLIVKPIFQRSFWRWLTALLLGLVAWWAVNWWLEPKPVWQLRYANDEVNHQPYCEDESGTWLFMSERRTTGHRNGRWQYETTAYTILDASTGKTVSQLHHPEHAFSQTSDYFRVELQSLRIIGQTLWRCVKYKKEDLEHVELRAWHFTQDDKEQVVQHWTFSPSTPFEITFSSRHASTFAVTTEFPWQPGLATLMTDGWSGLTSLIALGSSVTPKSAMIPWVRTYRLQDQPGNKPRLLASWTLPPLRWGTPVLSPTMDFVMFDDAELPGRTWKLERHGYCQPLGLLQFDGLSGQPKMFVTDPSDKSVPRHIELWGNLLLVHHVASARKVDFYDIRTGHRYSWPDEFPPLGQSTAIQFDLKHPRQMIFQFAGQDDEKEYLHVRWNDSTFTGSRVNISNEHFRYCMPAYLHDSLLVNVAVSQYQHPFLVWLRQQARWLDRAINTYWPLETMGLHFYDVTTSKKVWQIKCVEPYLNVNSTKRVYTSLRNDRTLIEQTDEPTLEAWAIPFQIYSPWWGRIAGNLVCILVLLPKLPRPTHTPKFPPPPK